MKDKTDKYEKSDTLDYHRIDMNVTFTVICTYNVPAYNYRIITSKTLAKFSVTAFKYTHQLMWLETVTSHMYGAINEHFTVVVYICFFTSYTMP